MSTFTNKKALSYLFALRRVSGIGDISAHKLLKHLGDPQAIFEASDEELKNCQVQSKSVKSIRSLDFSQFDPVFKWLDVQNNIVIPFGSPFYPPLLAQIAAPPLFLFAIGKKEHLLNHQIAVVGSRAPTPQGIANTRLLSKGLVEHGLTITSGLALGIDGEAHRAALESGGYTVAVTGTGLARVYPAAHKKLAHAITDNGVLISECFPDEGINPGNFPKRNRIIAGLSLGTLVIEAAERSGSLITAKIAMEESREVFAVPGSISNPVSRGCHSIIREGATLVENSEHILEQLPSLNREPFQAQPNENRKQLNPEAKKLLNCVDYDITSLDSIAARSNLSIESVTSKLLLLELDGWVSNSAGGYSRI